MANKINLKEIKQLIVETKLEEQYRQKFVENFKDVREQAELSEEEIEQLAEVFFKEIFSNR